MKLKGLSKKSSKDENHAAGVAPPGQWSDATIAGNQGMGYNQNALQGLPLDASQGLPLDASQGLPLDASQGLPLDAPQYPPPDSYYSSDPAQHPYPPQPDGSAPWPGVPCDQGYENDRGVAIQKAWRKMVKKFKGGVPSGIMGGVSAGIVFILIPLVPLIILRLMAPPDLNIDEFPEFVGDFLNKLKILPIYMGWFMVVAGSMKGYFRRGTPERAVAAVSFLAGKALFIFALLSPFIISVDMDFVALNINFVNYFKLIYAIIALQCGYAVMEYVVLKDDLESYLQGEIPIEYYPKKYRPLFASSAPPQP